MRIVVTGGHHTTALAVIQKLKKHDPDIQIFWFGHKYSMAGDKNVSAEYQEVTRLFEPCHPGGSELRRKSEEATDRIPSRLAKTAFINLKAGKFYKTYDLRQLIRIPFGFFQALYWLIKIKPDFVLSFGGYLAVPTVIAAYVLRIPSFTHDQTISPGLANRFIAHFVKKIFISWQATEKFFPKDKTVFTGNPLRKSIIDLAKGVKPELKTPFWQAFSSDLPIVYITGGKQGSHVINQAILESLNDLLTLFNVIHQCGSSTIFNDYEMLKQTTDKLPSDLKNRYFVKNYFFEREVAEILSGCDFVISRAGANAVYELAALGKPALLIPIPWVSHNEQYKNAEILVKSGIAKILEEKNLSGQTLVKECRKIKNNLDQYQANSEKAESLVKLDAAEKIVEEIFEKKIFC